MSWSCYSRVAEKKNDNGNAKLTKCNEFWRCDAFRILESLTREFPFFCSTEMLLLLHLFSLRLLGSSSAIECAIVSNWAIEMDHSWSIICANAHAPNQPESAYLMCDSRKIRTPTLASAATWWALAFVFTSFHLCSFDGTLFSLVRFIRYWSCSLWLLRFARIHTHDVWWWFHRKRRKKQQTSKEKKNKTKISKRTEESKRSEKKYHAK